MLTVQVVQHERDEMTSQNRSLTTRLNAMSDIVTTHEHYLSQVCHTTTLSVTVFPALFHFRFSLQVAAVDYAHLTVWMWVLKPSSHRWHGHVSGVNRISDRSRLSATENFKTVLSSLEMRWGLLKTVLTCCQFCSHHWQDKTVLSCRQCELDIIENSIRWWTL